MCAVGKGILITPVFLIQDVINAFVAGGSISHKGRFNFSLL